MPLWNCWAQNLLQAVYFKRSLYLWEVFHALIVELIRLLELAVLIVHMGHSYLKLHSSVFAAFFESFVLFQDLLYFDSFLVELDHETDIYQVEWVAWNFFLLVFLLKPLQWTSKVTKNANPPYCRFQQSQAIYLHTLCQSLCLLVKREPCLFNFSESYSPTFLFIMLTVSRCFFLKMLYPLFLSSILENYFFF